MKFAMFLLAYLLTVPVLADEELRARDYYPLTVGSTWTMQLVGPQGEREMVNTIEGIDEVNDRKLHRLSSSLNGSVVATEHLEIGEKGITRNQFNGIPISPPIVLLPHPIELGKSFTVKEVKLGGDTMAVEVKVAEKLEKVSVPAGEFEAVHVTVTAKPAEGEVVSEYWFAKGVGIVKQDLKLGEVSVTNSLISYEIAKVKPKPKKAEAEK